MSLSLLVLARVYHLARLVVASSGREALRRGLPMYLTLAIGAFVVFAGNGLSASSVVRLVDESIWLRAGFLAMWLVAALPAVGAVVHNRQVLFLKALPVPAREILAIFAAVLAFAEAPWIVLWARGASPLAAAGASLSALALHALWLSRPWRPGTALLFVATLALWLCAPSALACPGASLAFVLGLHSAWQRAPREAGERLVWPMRAPATLSLSAAYLATLLRAHSAIIVRCTYLCLSGALITFLLLRNNSIVSFSARTELAEALFVPLASVPLAGLVGPLLRTERQAEWVLSICNVSPGRRRRATAVTLAALAALLALPYCTVLVLGLRLGAFAAARVLAEHVLLAASLACVAETIARRAVTGDGRDGMRLILGMGGLAIVALASLLAVDRTAALLGWPVVAAGVLLLRAPARRTIHPGQSWKGTTMLEVSDVQKTLGSQRVLRGVDLVLGDREVVLIHGANGAGKSTLLRVVSGLTPADAGTLKLGAATLGRDSVRYKAQLGYVPDSTDAFPDLLVGEYVTLVQALRRPSAASVEVPEPWLRRLGVDRTWRQAIASLSFGQRKRLCTLAALVGNPWLLVLDEPSNGLDPGGVELMIELISERTGNAQATLCCTNDTAFAARVAGTEYRLDEGRLHVGRITDRAATTLGDQPESLSLSDS